MTTCLWVILSPMPSTSPFRSCVGPCGPCVGTACAGDLYTALCGSIGRMSESIRTKGAHCASTKFQEKLVRQQERSDEDLETRSHSQLGNKYITCSGHVRTIGMALHGPDHELTMLRRTRAQGGAFSSSIVE